jgi:leucyl aminopeptidase
MSITFKTNNQDPKTLKKGELFLMYTQEQYKKLKWPKSHIKVSEKEFSAEKSQYTKFHINNLRLHLIGLGEEKKLNQEMIRKAGGTIASVTRSLKISQANVSLDNLKDSASPVTEGIILGNYRFHKYKTEDKKKQINLNTITLHSKKDIKKQVKHSQITCNATNYVRDLQFDNADLVTPAYMEKQARQLAKKHKLKVKVFQQKDLKKMGANLLLAVGQGSSCPPRMIILEYNGDKKSKKSTAVLGKGVTFDTGGLNLKPTGYIEDMRVDMSGAAVVLGTIKAAAELKLKTNIYGVIPTAESVVGAKAFKPQDVFKSYLGKTVEINNTDAEGRLLLADALAYTEKNLKPSKMINFATLTGAAVVALGFYVTPMCGTDDKLLCNLFKSGESTYERLWTLPLYEEYIDQVNKSDVADFGNLTYGKGRYAGMIMGAAFLSKFVNKTPWAHIDIAGPAWLTEPRDYYQQKGATGVGVRLMIDYLENNQ